jgi:3',5'-cyclic AMP phosphodiesterase CpdA
MEVTKGTKTILLHITDFHFGDQVPINYASGKVSQNQIAELIISELRSFEPASLIVAVGGDIADKADEYYYQTARRFFKILSDAFDRINVSYIICPGNHDINMNVAEKFGAFNLFARELTRSSEFVYSREHTAGIFELHGWSFITINTAYKEGRGSSEVNISDLKKKLAIARYPVILLLHHHLIPMYQNDHSPVANALDVFKTVLQSDVKLMLHGHVHSAVRIYIGDGIRQLPVIGCGALLPRLSDGYLNQFNILDLHTRGNFTPYTYAITNESPNEVGPAVIKNYLE